MNTLFHKTHLIRLKLHVWLRWLAVEFEPAESDEFRMVAARYATAKRELNEALLKERERRMNRRVF